MKEHEKPVTINTGHVPSCEQTIRELKMESLVHKQVHQRKATYLYNRIEADHAILKRLIRATLGFNSMKAVYATSKGFEIMICWFELECIYRI